MGYTCEYSEELELYDLIDNRVKYYINRQRMLNSKSKLGFSIHNKEYWGLFDSIESKHEYILCESLYVKQNKPIAFESTDALRLRYAKLRGLILYEI